MRSLSSGGRRSTRRALAASTLAAVLVATPLALADTGDPVREGTRNPTAGSSSRETQVIARTGRDAYGTRQSNLGAGGGAIYGCRSTLDIAGLGDPKRSTPCLRVNNLRSGKAFDLQSNTGRVIGVIQSGNRLATPKPAVAPFVTNATGVALGLNADRLDNLQAADIVAQAVQAAKTANAAPGACPANTVLAGGGCLETAPRAAATYTNAATACAQAGRRMVPPDVLLGARGASGIDLGAAELSADVSPASVTLVTNAVVDGVVTVSDAGAMDTVAQTATTPYRCITR